MSRNLGLLLRLVGPLIQLLALMVYLEYRGRGARFLGAPVETLCLIGIGLGLILVVLGLILSMRRGQRRRRPPSLELRLGSDKNREDAT